MAYTKCPNKRPMTTQLLLFLLLYWPFIRIGQVLFRMAEGKSLGTVRETVIQFSFFDDFKWWFVYGYVAYQYLP